MGEIIGEGQVKDAEVKQAIEERVNAARSLMAQNISQTKLEIQGIKSEVQIAIYSLRAEVQVAGGVSQAHMQQQMTGLTAEAEKSLNELKGMIHEARSQAANAPSRVSEGKGQVRIIPVLESKVWTNMKVLSANNTDYREWSEKFKNAFSQVRPGSRKVLEELEQMAGQHMGGGMLSGKGDVTQMQEIT